MYLDESFSGGGGPIGPFCLACKNPIQKHERSTRVEFHDDPHGDEGRTGEYHFACGKAFASIAHAMKVLGRGFGR